MVITETHPEPAKALSDGAQALLLSELDAYVEDMSLVRACYEQRVKLASRYGAK
jgi:3-deoxy-7-phosphoheptulonate synthase